MRFGRPTIASAVAVLGLSLAVAACGSDNGSGTASASGTGSGKKIALLLPEHTTARYETQDRPHFESMVKRLCPTCSVVYENANQDASEQQSQAESVLTQGIDAMVLDPVDATSASTIVRMAKAQTRAGDQLRPAHLGREPRRVHLVRQRARRERCRPRRSRRS